MSTAYDIKSTVCHILGIDPLIISLGAPAYTADDLATKLIENDITIRLDMHSEGGWRLKANDMLEGDEYLAIGKTLVSVLELAIVAFHDEERL